MNLLLQCPPTLVEKEQDNWTLQRAKFLVPLASTGTHMLAFMTLPCPVEVLAHPDHAGVGATIELHDLDLRPTS